MPNKTCTKVFLLSKSSTSRLSFASYPQTIYNIFRARSCQQRKELSDVTFVVACANSHFLRYADLSCRCLRSVGIALPHTSLNDMAAVMDAHGDGLIPTAPVLEFLRKEAGIPVVASSDGGAAKARKLSSKRKWQRPLGGRSRRLVTTDGQRANVLADTRFQQ